MLLCEFTRHFSDYLLTIHVENTELLRLNNKIWFFNKRFEEKGCSYPGLFRADHAE